MANDNSRKFKQNHIIFCIQPWIIEFSRPVAVSYTHLDVYKRQALASVAARQHVVDKIWPASNLSEVAPAWVREKLSPLFKPQKTSQKKTQENP